MHCYIHTYKHFICIKLLTRLLTYTVYTLFRHKLFRYVYLNHLKWMCFSLLKYYLSKHSLTITVINIVFHWGQHFNIYLVYKNHITSLYVWKIYSVFEAWKAQKPTAIDTIIDFQNYIDAADMNDPILREKVFRSNFPIRRMNNKIQKNGDSIRLIWIIWHGFCWNK